MSDHSFGDHPAVCLPSAAKKGRDPAPRPRLWADSLSPEEGPATPPTCWSRQVPGAREERRAPATCSAGRLCSLSRAGRGLQVGRERGIRADLSRAASSPRWCLLSRISLKTSSACRCSELQESAPRAVSVCVRFFHLRVNICKQLVLGRPGSDSRTISIHPLPTFSFSVCPRGCT